MLVSESSKTRKRVLEKTDQEEEHREREREREREKILLKKKTVFTSIIIFELWLSIYRYTSFPIPE